VSKIELVSMGMGNFVRVRVKLDVRKVLSRFVSISRAGVREPFQSQYEKIPKFCGACGFFGHSHLECGSDEHDETSLKWGDFLKADWDTWHGRGVNFSRGGGRIGGRFGRGGDSFGGSRDQRGRGVSMMPWRHNTTNSGALSDDPDLKDKATSPGKTNAMDLDKTNHVPLFAKHALDMDNDELMSPSEGVQHEKNDLALAMVTDGIPSAEGLAGKEDKDRNKRPKKDGADSPPLGSEGSFDGSVRSQ
jgi:hypothetical protein